MRKNILVLLMLAAVCGLAANAHALEISLEENRGEAGSIGYVDMDRVFAANPETAKAKEDFIIILNGKKKLVDEKKNSIAVVRAKLSVLVDQRRELAAKIMAYNERLAQLCASPDMTAQSGKAFGSKSPDGKSFDGKSFDGKSLDGKTLDGKPVSGSEMISSTGEADKTVVTHSTAAIKLYGYDMMVFPDNRAVKISTKPAETSASFAPQATASASTTAMPSGTMTPAAVAISTVAPAAAMNISTVAITGPYVFPSTAATIVPIMVAISSGAAAANTSTTAITGAYVFASTTAVAGDYVSTSTGAAISPITVAITSSAAVVATSTTAVAGAAVSTSTGAATTVTVAISSNAATSANISTEAVAGAAVSASTETVALSTGAVSPPVEAESVISSTSAIAAIMVADKTKLIAIDAEIAPLDLDLAKKFAELKSFKEKTESELETMENRRSEIILGKIYITLRELAAAEGISVVVDKTNTLYGQKAVDLTDKLMEKIKGE